MKVPRRGWEAGWPWVAPRDRSPGPAVGLAVQEWEPVTAAQRDRRELQDRAEGGRGLTPPAPLGGSRTERSSGRFGLPVRSAPCEMVPLRGVAVTAPGKASSARRSALPVPAAGSRAGRLSAAPL